MINWPPQFIHNETEAGIVWFHNGNRVEVLFDTADQRIVWIGKFDNAFVQGGDEPWPTGLTEMLKRLYSQ